MLATPAVIRRRSRAGPGVSVVLVVGLAQLVACSTGRSSLRDDVAGPTQSEDLQRFVVAVDLLPVDPGAAPRERVVDAFRKLADALRAVGQDRDILAGAERIDALAGRLEGADAADAADSVVAATALRESVDALGRISGAPDDRLTEAKAALAEFDERRPLPSQIAIVREVLANVANGLLVARDLAPSVTTSVHPRQARPASGKAPSIDAARHCSERVSALATSPVRDLRASFATTLLAFSDALEQAAASDPRLASIRAAAARIRDADALSVDTVPWARDALTSTIDLIDDATAHGRPEVVTDWLSRGRTAAAALADGSFLSFQRAPLQEACRLIADALLFLGATKVRADQAALPESVGALSGADESTRQHRRSR